MPPQPRSPLSQQIPSRTLLPVNQRAVGDWLSGETSAARCVLSMTDDYGCTRRARESQRESQREPERARESQRESQREPQRARERARESQREPLSCAPSDVYGVY